MSYVFPYSLMMDMVCQGIFNAREYQPLPFLNAHTIVDIGANIGCTSMLYAATYPGARIFALEPAREAFAYLQRNTAPFPQIRIFNIGAFDRDAAPRLHLGNTASVTNSLVPHTLTGGLSETITLRRISTWLAEQGIDRISLLKVDTEGAEMAILTDVAPLFDKIDAIVFEYHSESDRLALDHLLKDRFIMFSCYAENPHRGTHCMVAREIIRTRTSFESFALAHPTI